MVQVPGTDGEPQEEGLLWRPKKAAMFMFDFDSVCATALKQL